jgi:uridylate kinase
MDCCDSSTAVLGVSDAAAAVRVVCGGGAEAADCAEGAEDAEDAEVEDTIGAAGCVLGSRAMV